MEKYTCVHVFGELINYLISGRMMLYSVDVMLFLDGRPALNGQWGTPQATAA